MSAPVYQSAVIPSEDDLVELYDSVGWSAYTKDSVRLAAAVRASLAVCSAHQDGKLIGLSRLVGDGLTIVYLQDFLVSPDYRRLGIGRDLFQRVLAPFSDVRQKVLITDDEPYQRAFYESMGFTETGDLDHPLRTFVQFG